MWTRLRSISTTERWATSIARTESACTTPNARRTIMSLCVCVPEAPDDGDDEAAETTTNQTVTCRETQRMKTLRHQKRPWIRTSWKRSVDGAENQQLTIRYLEGMCAANRSEADSLTTWRTIAPRAGSWQPRRQETWSMTCTLEHRSWKALRTTIILAKRRDGRHRLRDSALCDTTVTVAHANLDEAVGFSIQGTLLERKECPLVLEAHHGTRMAFEAARSNTTWECLERMGGRRAKRCLVSFDVEIMLGSTGVAETSSWSKAAMKPCNLDDSHWRRSSRTATWRTWRRNAMTEKDGMSWWTWDCDIPEDAETQSQRPLKAS